MGELEVEAGDIVIPGDSLGPASSYACGKGTCIRDGKVHSKLVGMVSVTDPEDQSKDPKQIISVLHHKTPCLGNIPTIGLRTICRVINISERQAKVNMLSVEDAVLPEPFHGIIRREDIRAMEKDAVEMFNSFRPSDLIRARVVAYGEGQAYILSTAENELGVVSAVCECGENLLPASWCEMQCSKTGKREKRKVAKVKDAIPVLI